MARPRGAAHLRAALPAAIVGLVVLRALALDHPLPRRPAARGALEPAARGGGARAGHELAPELRVVQVDLVLARRALAREGGLGEGAARARRAAVLQLVALCEQLVNVRLAELAPRRLALLVLLHDVVRAVLEQVDHLGARRPLVAALVAAAAAEQRLVEAELLARALEHALLVRVVRDQPVHLHLLRLPDAVAARHALPVEG